MKRKAMLSVAIALILSFAAALCACADKTDKPTPTEITYTVAYAAGEGSGSAPESVTVKSGAAITLAQNTFTYDGHVFDGWTAGGVKYNAGDSYTVTGNVTFTAAWREEGAPPIEVTYTVAYAAGEGSGSAPESVTVKSGAAVTLAQNTFTYDGHVFDGWTAGGVKYNAGDSYTVTGNVTFTAAWREESVEPVGPSPSFGEHSYSYDKIGGGDLWLPFDLDGAHFYYVRFDGVLLDDGITYYDSDKSVIVIDADFILDLELGSYTVTALTDAAGGDNSCVVEISQSQKTSFDSVTEKHIRYGLDDGVSFRVDFNGTAPVKLMQGDREVPSEFYDYDDEGITLDGEWAARYSIGNYRLFLSNNDRYAFTVTSNVLLSTDYDVVTVHDTTDSNRGLNPLYQYADNVSIVDSPSEMNSGKALKITPNNVEVPLDCNSYLTIKPTTGPLMWYPASFTEGKTYYVSFDYMTRDTIDGGTLYFGTSYTEYPLPFGPDNDNTVRHFSALVPYDDIGNGLRITAKFLGDDAELYIDNYRIVELDAVPTVGTGAYDASGNYVVPFGTGGYGYTVEIDGNAAECSYNTSAQALVVSASEIATLVGGEHKLNIITPVGAFTVSFRVVDDRVAEFTSGKATYHYLKDSQIKVYGSFDDTIEIVSLKQKFLVNNNIDPNYNFSYLNDTTTNFAQYVSLTPGLNGTGYITMPKALLDKFWGEVTFVVEFNNGDLKEFAVDSADVAMYTDYDTSTVTGTRPSGEFVIWTPLNSGLAGDVSIAEREKGNKAFYIRSVPQNAADMTAFTTEYMNYAPFDWYRVYGETGDCMRVTFDYRISGFEQGDVYFVLYFDAGEDTASNYFGGAIVLDEWNRLCIDLIADGQVHTFDSGWFTIDSAKRLSKINFPAFDAADGKFIMFDNYRVVKSSEIGYVLDGFVGEYVKGRSDKVTFDAKDQMVLDVKIDGAAVRFTQVAGVVELNSDDLGALENGVYTVTVTTTEGEYVYKGFAVSDDRTAYLTQTSANVVYGQTESVKLAGEFDTTLTAVSLTRSGTDDNDASRETPSAMKISYVTVEADGLTLSRELIDQAYGTTTYAVTFDNGKKVEFTLTSNLIYFTDYDETCIFDTDEGNTHTCQDTAMVKLVADENGNRHLEYRPEDAVLGHSVGAINGGSDANGVFTFKDPSRTSNDWWKNYDFAVGQKMIFFFDYVLENPNNAAHNINFYVRKRSNGEYTGYKLDGADRFELVVDYDVDTIEICCGVSSPSMVEGVCLKIDNFGFGIYVEPPTAAGTATLTQTSANVVYGQTEVVKLAGKFDTALTVKSLTRSGTDDNDASRETPSAMKTSYITVEADGLTLSSALVDQAYGTTTYVVTFDNDKTVGFTLTSNLMYFTDYDETCIFETGTGNTPTCQDMAMVKLVADENGNRHLEYRPEDAELEGSIGSIHGTHDENSLFTFRDPSRTDAWLWKTYDFAVGKKLVFFFDYEVVNPNNAEHNIRFWVRRKGGGYADYKLDGSGTFRLEVDYDIDTIMIACTVSSPDKVAGVYMKIDNFGFGAID